MNKKVPQPKKVPVHIRRHLLKQVHSEQTIKAYCQKNDINPQTFYGWRKRYGKQALAATVLKNDVALPRITFASLGTMSTQLQHRALFDIRFPGGTAVSVYTGTTAQVLAPFLDLISGSNVLC